MVMVMVMRQARVVRNSTSPGDGMTEMPEAFGDSRAKSTADIMHASI